MLQFAGEPEVDLGEARDRAEQQLVSNTAEGDAAMTHIMSATVNEPRFQASFLRLGLAMDLSETDEDGVPLPPKQQPPAHTWRDSMRAVLAGVPPFEIRRIARDIANQVEFARTHSRDELLYLLVLSTYLSLEVLQTQSLYAGVLTHFAAQLVALASGPPREEENSKSL